MPVLPPSKMMNIWGVQQSTNYGRFPENNSPHKGAIRIPNQCEITQLIHNGIHTPSPDPNKTLIKPSKKCRNISQPPLQSHLNWTIM